MARIRTIKPEFFTDGKISRLSADSALFFVGLWTCADDYGYVSSDTRELALRMPRWRPQSLHHMLSSLAAHGLVRVSITAGVAQVIGWGHQRINDRRSSKWATMDNDGQIKWDEIKIDAQTSDRKPLGLERRGEERRGRESLSGQRPPVTPPPPVKKSPPNTELNRKIWEAYRSAYAARYQKDPIRNLTVNGQISQIGKRLGEEAIEVVKFYVGHNDGFYLKKTHSIGQCLADAESLHTQWVRGRPVTSSLVRQYEKQQGTQNLLDMIDRGELK